MEMAAISSAQCSAGDAAWFDRSVLRGSDLVRLDDQYILGDNLVHGAGRGRFYFVGSIDHQCNGGGAKPLLAREGSRAGGSAAPGSTEHTALPGRTARRTPRRVVRFAYC